jgi:DNA invertase Pin-like site-specific DNA recombinase
MAQKPLPSIACYCRVSSRRQKYHSQKAEITRWRRNHRLSLRQVQWFIDTESGSPLSRSAFAQLQKARFEGTGKPVVVWKLERLARRPPEGISLLAAWGEQGVRGVSVTPQIDLNGAVGRLLARGMVGLAEIAQEYRRERQAAGIAVAQRKGVDHGRVNGTTKAQLARAQRLRARGLTAPEIATPLGVPPRTVFRSLAQGNPETPGVL